MSNEDWTPVVSSKVSALAREGNDLLVKYNNGAIYRYFGAGVFFQDAIGASSVGVFLKDNVEKAYKYSRESQ